ncbi:hypothetical protein PSAB6_520015 [Paraburkholderia sabiae]|jgi:hypothetical protein|nr:hypothetical protein PSAB6_520015 [Paraburkholderia sabiae]
MTPQTSRLIFVVNIGPRKTPPRADPDHATVAKRQILTVLQGKPRFRTHARPAARAAHDAK